MSTSLEALSNDLAGAVERAGASVVAIHARRRIPSSGILWRRGLVVAADHTVHKDEDVRVTMGTGAGARDVRATVAGRDPGTDLCILRLGDDATSGLGEPAIVARGPLRVGQLVLALGRPGANVTASFGAVSAVGAEWRTWRGGRIDQLVRLDLAVYDGFSGGALVDAAGHVLGICTSGLARGAALAVPAATIDRVADALLAGGGRVRRGFLGIGTQPVRLPESVRGRLAPVGDTVPEVGLMVVAVEPGAPAERAGVMLGDVVVALDDAPTEDPRDVIAALGADTVGQAVRATLVRAGAPLTLSITVGEQPPAGARG
jgi:S1-C subfamily serine protease